MPKDSDAGLLLPTSNMSQEFAHLIATYAEDAIVFTDRDGLVEWCNGAFSRQTGFELSDIMGRKPGSFLQGPETDPATVAEISHALANCERVNTQILNYSNAGVPFWVDMTIIPILDHTSRVIHFMSMQREVTERVRLIADLEAAVAREEKRKVERQALQALTEWLYLADTEEEVAALLGRTMLELLPSTSGALYLWDVSGALLTQFAAWGEGGCAEDLEPQMCWALRRGRAYHCGASTLDLVCPHVLEDARGGDRHHFCIPIFAQGKAMGLLHVEPSRSSTRTSRRRDDSDETDLWSLALMAAEQVGLSLAKIQLQKKLKEETLRDALTGLRNRRWFEEKAATRFRRALRQRTPFSLICMDLDHFKAFNDRHGHAAGDEALRRTGQALREHVPDPSVACRIGGEEFVLVCPHVSAGDATRLVEALQTDLASEAIATADGAVPMVTFSAGVVQQAGEEDLGSLYRRADAALYAAKEAGRGCIRCAVDQVR